MVAQEPGDHIASVILKAFNDAAAAFSGRCLGFYAAGGSYVPIKVAADGTVATSASGGGGSTTITSPIGPGGGVQIEGVANAQAVAVTGEVTAIPQRAEGDAHIALQRLFALGALREDVPTAFVANDQYGFLEMDAVGRLWTHDAGAIQSDGAAYAAGELSMLGAVQADAGTAGTADGNVNHLITDNRGRLIVSLGAAPAGVDVSGSTVAIAGTVPVSAAALPLPAGAATETTLAALNTKVTAVNTGAVTISAALPAGAAVIGQVTANAGTNLNTSALALEAGNLATLAGVVSSARAAVNPISGQAGVDGASGTASAKTQRVVLATDVGLPAGANALGSVSVTGTVTVGSHAVTNAGTFAVQDSQKIADNAAFTDGTTPLNPIGLILDDTAGTALTENDIAAARINPNRAQVMVLEDDTTRGAAGRAAVTASGVTGASVGLCVRAVPFRGTRSDTYTAAANGTTIDGSQAVFSKYTIQVSPTGVVTSWSVVIEGSLDNITFTTIATHTNANSGALVTIGANAAQCLYVRSRCAAVVLGAGTNIIAVILAS